MKIKILLFLSALVTMFCWIQCGEADTTSTAPTEKDITLQEQAKALFGTLDTIALNPENTITTAKIVLGKKLFFDTKLSKQGNNSCNSCHNIQNYGVDHLHTSKGDAGKFGPRNSPTVFNAALHLTQFWDGRAKDVEEQAGLPILNPIEMAIPHKEFLVHRLTENEEYQNLFSKAFPNEKNYGISYLNIQKAIAAFERTLITPAPIDEFIAGNMTALNQAEKKGLETFIETGCITCHSGNLFGGKMYQKFGLFEDYWKETKSAVIDNGIYTISKKESDKYFFKVPSLRNVTETYPYFHDGSVDSLKDAIRIMAKIQLNKELTTAQIDDISTFLHTLTGKINSDWYNNL